MQSLFECFDILWSWIPPPVRRLIIRTLCFSLADGLVQYDDRHQKWQSPLPGEQSTVGMSDYHCHSRLTVAVNSAVCTRLFATAFDLFPAALITSSCDPSPLLRWCGWFGCLVAGCSCHLAWRGRVRVASMLLRLPLLH